MVLSNTGFSCTSRSGNTTQRLVYTPNVVEGASISIISLEQVSPLGNNAALAQQWAVAFDPTNDEMLPITGVNGEALTLVQYVNNGVVPIREGMTCSNE
jgi:hypothetical protein